MVFTASPHEFYPGQTLVMVTEKNNEAGSFTVTNEAWAFIRENLHTRVRIEEKA